MAHFDGLRRLLDSLQIGYVVNPRLVRGLDYYTHTVFEWITGALGSQGTVCAGGRYDGLVEQLGGRATPAAGFAIGVDRLVLLHEALQRNYRVEPIDGYCVVLDAAHTSWAMDGCQRLREALPDVRLRVNAGGGQLKNQMKRADASGANWALIIGEDEVADNEITLKWLRAAAPQERLTLDRADCAIGHIDERRELTVAEYLNDDDRVLALRKWWETNGTMLVVGLVLMIAAVIGWRWYNDHTQAREEAASATYQQYVEARQRGAKPRNSTRRSRRSTTNSDAPAIGSSRCSTAHSTQQGAGLREGDASISRRR